MAKLKKKVIDGVAPITLSECVYMGDKDNLTLKEKLLDIKNKYPQCLNFKGSFDWEGLKETFFDNCQRGDFWINDKTDKLMAMHCYLHYPGDVMYFDGLNVCPLKLSKSYYKKNKQRYDICIIGGGAGGMGAAYALKDKGYNVILIDKLDSLGGSHLNSIPSLLAGPINGTWFKDIMQDAYNKGYMRFGKALEVGEGSQFEKLWKGGLYNSGTTYENWGNEILPSTYWTSQRYYNDLKDKIDVRLNTEFLESYLEPFNGKEKIGGIKVRDLVNGLEYDIFAEYFIDCSADGVLCRSGKEEGKDYFIGSDPKSMYNEEAYTDGYSGDRYKINTVECGCRIGGDSYLPADKVRDEDRTKWKDYADVTSKVNGGVLNSPNEYHGFVSTSTGNSIDSKIYIDKGHDYAHSLGYFRSLSHFKKLNRVDRYMEVCKLLGVRESYRIKCDKMLTQKDCEHRITSSEISSNHIIALSSWWVDLHNDATLQGNVNNSFLNGIPYESITPSAFSNVLIGSRCFGASHIALASFRLIKTMMSLGYVCGHAMSQCVDNWLEDVRNVDIAKLQDDCGIYETINEIEEYF